MICQGHLQTLKNNYSTEQLKSCNIEFVSETLEEIPVFLSTGTSVYMGEGRVLILFRSYFKKLDMFLKSLVNL